MANTRNIALNVLLKIENEGAYSNIALNNAIKENRLSGVDSSFVSALVYGVLERKITLDYIIRSYSKIPLRKIETKTKNILRLGILQLLFMDKFPTVRQSTKALILPKSTNFRNHRVSLTEFFVISQGQRLNIHYPMKRTGFDIFR